MMDFKKEIRLAFSENRLAVCASIAILLISLLLGYFLQSHLSAYLNPVVDNISRQVESGNIRLTFYSIFSNNIRVVIMMFVMGIFACFSAVILAFNGLFVGYFTAIQADKLSTLLLLVPHGIFELPSCAIACASGFVLFNFIFRFLKTFASLDDGPVTGQLYESYVSNFDKLKQAILLLFVSAVLMVIAGFVEVYLTVPIAKFVISVIG